VTFHKIVEEIAKKSTKIVSCHNNMTSHGTPVRLKRFLQLRAGFRQSSQATTSYQKTTSTSGDTLRFRDAKPFADIPGPPQLPLIGCGYFMLKKEYREQVHHLYLKLSKQYGPLFRVNLFGVRFLVLTDPKDIQHVFQTDSEYPKMPSLSLIMGFHRWVLV
jgi:hypothetical protein